MTKNRRLYGLIAVLAICIAIGIGLSVGTETRNEGGNCTISISGRGIVSAEPNQVEIRLGVETEDKNVTKALEANSFRMNSTIEALKTLGISEDEIETTRFNIYPIKDYERKTVE
ncbi:MAG: SIMPL domain-containing protein, partial [Methanophagales archaeon]|nr:SIMPL domain-containing protein [Methanophagales archaeon]